MSSTDLSSPNESLEFSWNPAALRSKRTVSISTEGFTVEGGERIDWESIQGLSFAIHTVRGNTMMNLRMRLSAREEILAVNGGGQALASYCKMVRALVAAMEAARPDLRISIGNVGGARIGMFIVSLAGILVGAGMVAGGIHLAIEEGNWGHLGMSFFGLILCYFMVLLTLANLPWSKPPTHPLSEFWAHLERAEANASKPSADPRAGKEDG